MYRYLFVVCLFLHREFLQAAFQMLEEEQVPMQILLLLFACRAYTIQTSNIIFINITDNTMDVKAGLMATAATGLS